jgi:hypothetical protein
MSADPFHVPPSPRTVLSAVAHPEAVTWQGTWGEDGLSDERVSESMSP